MIFGRLLIAFTLIPVVELALLIEIGGYVGLFPTLALVIATGVAGAALARREGLRTFMEFQRITALGEMPAAPLVDGLLILIGAAFLLTPGILTDIVGFVLLIPPSRAWIRGRLQRWLERHVVIETYVETRSPSSSSIHPADVVDQQLDPEERLH